MYINNLYLENYGAYEKAEFDFSKGFNVLSGRTGQGKSHIIRAINYALLNKTFGTIEEDCNWGANHFVIKLNLSHKGKTFKINITYNRKGGAEKELWIDNDYYSGNADVTTKLSEYFDPSLTQAGIMSLQGKMDVVDATDSERRENLKKIYDLDFSKQVDRLKEEMAEVETQKTELEKEIYNLQNKDYTLQSLKDVLLTDEEYSNKQKELEKLRNDKAVYEQKIKYQIELSERKRKLRNQYDDVVAKRDKLNEQQESTKEEIDGISGKKQEIEKSFSSEQERIQKELDSVSISRVRKFDYKALEEAQEKKNEYKRQLDNITEKLKLIDKGVCPTCGRDFHTNDRSEYEQEYKKVLENYNEYTKTYDKLNEEKEKIEREKTKQEEQKQKKRELEKELENIKGNHEVKVQSLNEKEQYLSKNLKDYTKRLDEYAQQEKELSKELNDIQEKQGEPIQEKDYDTPIRQIEIEVKQHESILQENKIIKQNNERIKEQEKKDKEELQKKYKKKDKINKNITEYKEAVEILRKEFPNFVISTMVGELEQGMNSLLNMAYNGRYQVNIKENRKGLSVVYGPENKSIKLSSGGEKNLFNIGFKNAFSEIAGLKMLLLDEADNYMDDEIARHTFTVVNSLVENETFDQIIIITHKETVKELIEADFKGKVFHIEEGTIV